MSQEKKYNVNQCYHCGNKGLMEVLHEQKEVFGGTYMRDDGVVESDIEEHFAWILYKCPVCRKPSLIQTYCDESMYDQYNDNMYYYISNLYPLNNYKMDNVPLDISSSFEAALKVKDINVDLCLVGLRKVLELICKEKNATGRTLEKKIEDMVQKNVFPKEMEVAYWVIRQAGNKAVHEKNSKLTKYDIDEIATLLYSIINYLYIIPRKMIKLKEKINSEDKKEDNDGI